jgi:nicotinamidase/pyrazinamidase
MSKKGFDLQFLIIDAQNDFVDPKGSLYVPGAEGDAERLVKLIDRLGSKISDIHATLDSHHYVDIAHPVFWKDSSGNHPDPFTIITKDDVENGTWTTMHPGFAQRAKDYVTTLEQNGRYPLCIWPPHTLIGSWGYAVYPAIFEAFLRWEKNFAMVDYVTKGSNFWTEHYSAVQADVPDPQDPGTMLNTQLIQILQDADLIVLSGQALSHCLANTVRDIADNFGEENIKKLVLLEDTTSSVPGFENLGTQFVGDLRARGMQVTTSDKFLI